MLVHRLAAVAAVAAVALAQSSCSEDPVKPKPLEPESSSSSPTSTPSETPKPESAEEFIGRWLKAQDRMQGTGATTDYRALTRNCASCNSLANLVDRIYDSGGYIKFEGSRILKIAPTGRTPRTRTFEVGIRTGPTKYAEAKGGPVKSLTGNTDTYEVILEGRNGEWLVVSSTRLAS